MVLIQLWLGLIMFHFAMKFLGFKPDKTKLYCGIAGYSGSIPPNMANMKILGMYNIARGDDSCGIALDDKCYKGVGVNANWINFIENNKIPEYPSVNNTVIIHTRKATGGQHTAENAHPFEFFRGDNPSPTRKPYFIGCHNGTLKNEDALEKQFKMKDFKYNIDSQLLLKIISLATKKDSSSLKVLEQYKGGAALLFYWTSEPNTLYAWKGATKDYANYVEERPLFYWKTDGGVYISSIKESLKAIGGDDTTVFSFKQNTLFKINQGEIEELPMKFERDFYVATPSVTTFTPPVQATDVKTPLFPLQQTFINYPQYTFYGPTLLGDNKRYLLDCEPRPSAAEMAHNKIYLWRGRYCRNGHILANAECDADTGLEIDLNCMGYPIYSDKFILGDTTVKKYYFYKGLMVRDKEALARLLRLIKAGSVIFTGKFSSDVYKVEVKDIPPITLAELFVGLIVNPNDIRGTIKYSPVEVPRYSIDFYAGSIQPQFSNVTYTFQNGYFNNAVKKTVDSGVIEIPFQLVTKQKEVDIEKDAEIVTDAESKKLAEEEAKTEELVDLSNNIAALTKKINESKNPRLQQLKKPFEEMQGLVETEFDEIAKSTALIADSDIIYRNN